MTHICVGNLTITGSDNGLSPDQRQAIIWTNVGILLIGPLGTNFSEVLIEIHTFSFKKIHLKMSSGKWRPFCLGLNVLKQHRIIAWMSNYIHIKPWNVIDHPCQNFNSGSIDSLRMRQNGRHFTDNPSKHIFLSHTIQISIKFSLKLVSKGQINNIPALVPIMAWRCPSDKLLSEPMMVSFLAHICVTRPQLVKPVVKLWHG